MKLFFSLSIILASLVLVRAVDPAIGKETHFTRQLKTNDTGFGWRDSTHLQINSPISARWYGAKGDGITDDYSALTNALAVAAAAGETLFLPAGTYLISKTITLPANHFSIRGEPMDLAYKGFGPVRAVIKVSGAFTALQSQRLVAPNNTLAFWSSYFDLRDIYLEGPYLQATAVPGCVGLDLTGVRVFQISNVHVEGFGTGFVFRNCSEAYVYNLLVQNCVYGIVDGRDPAGLGTYYDCLITHINCQSLNNQISILEDSPRSSYWIGGELINNVATPNILITNCASDSAMVFDKVVVENHSTTYAGWESDTNGFGQLVIQNCNLETDQNMPIVGANGWFDLIKLEGNSMQRSTDRTNALVWAHSPPGQNWYLRTGRIVVENNAHSWFDSWIRNDWPGSRPENDFIPSGYVNLNPNPNADHGMDGIISIAGNVQFNTNSICGMARTWWASSTTNNVYTLNVPTNLTVGLDSVYATATLYDNGGADVPTANVQGWGAQGVGWNRIGPCFLGYHTNLVTGVIFSKYGWWFVQLEPAPTNALTSVQLFNIYGGAGLDDTGIERFCVYAPAQKNPYGAVTPTHSSIPSTGLEGWHRVGDFYRNDFTTNKTAYGWFCTADGNPGTWVSVGDAYGTTNHTQNAIAIFNTGTDNGITASGVYAGTNGNVAIGSSDVSTYPLSITKNGGLPQLRLQSVDAPGIQFSDLVDFAPQIHVDPTNNVLWLGDGGTHFTLGGGKVGVGVANPAAFTASLTVNGAMTAHAGTFKADGATVTIAPSASNNASLLVFNDDVVGSARGSFGFANNGDTNMTINVNYGSLDLKAPLGTRVQQASSTNWIQFLGISVDGGVTNFNVSVGGTNYHIGATAY